MFFLVRLKFSVSGSKAITDPPFANTKIENVPIFAPRSN